MKTKQIWLSPVGWQCALMVDGEPCRETIALFGTHIIPTPFTAAAPAEMIIAQLSADGSKVVVS